MALNFKSTNHLQNDIQNIIKEDLKTALFEINNTDLTQAKRVHQVRKMCKRSRALLQLVKPILRSPQQYQIENNHYKNMAKLLAGSREAKVMHDMFDILIKRNHLKRSEFSDIKEALLDAQSHEHLDEKQTSQNLQTCTHDIKNEIENLSGWELTTDNLYELKIGYQQTYRKARKYMQKAHKNGNSEAFHDFRKYAKYHMFHTILLSQNSLLPKNREKELKKLTDLLGVEHDLTLFEHFLSENKKSLPSAEKLIPYLHKEQKRLRKKAKKLENHLFKLPPKKVTSYTLF